MSAPIKIGVRPPLSSLAVYGSSPSMMAIPYVIVGGEDRRSVFQQVQSVVYPWWVPVRFQTLKDTSSLEARLWEVFKNYRAETANEVKTAVLSWKVYEMLIKNMHASVMTGAITHHINADGSRVTSFCGVTIIPCDRLSDSVALLYGANRGDVLLGPMHRSLLDLPLEHRVRVQMHLVEKLLKSSCIAENLGVPFALYN